MLMASLGAVSQAIAIEEDPTIGAKANKAISHELLSEEGIDNKAVQEVDTATEVEGKVITIDMPLAEVAIENDVAVIPDITQLTLDSFNLVDGEGSAANMLALGDLSQILDLRNMTVGAALTGQHRHELQALTLDQYDFLAEMT